MTTPTRCIGVDVGGTFTDFVWVSAAGCWVEKRLSTPDDPARAVLDGLAEIDPAATSPVVHGTTVATNTLLERRGARTALVATAGFGDLLALGRGERADLYALAPRPRPTLIPAELCFELDERVGADGQPILPLDAAALDRTVGQVVASGAEAVAVCLLFSYLRPDHERALGAALARATGGPDHVSLSVDVLPEFREFERASTTAVNAYVAPRVTRYLDRLAAAAAPRPLSVMGSHAGTLPAAEAARLPVTTILSGPAAGVAGGLAVARRAGFPRVLTFDMGGTSTDVALCDDQVPFTAATTVGGFPVHRAAVDVHTVGAGGGSIIAVDAGGALKVGPASAGADPGPAAYGRGGRLPTVTDAHVVLGRLPAGLPLAGGLRLDPAAARVALAPLAAALGLSIEALALGAIAVANATMERALRRVSVEQGHAPGDFTLLAFGGAGPLHACELAAAIGARRVLVPATPGALSAMGLATMPPVATASRSVLRLAGAGEQDAGTVSRAGGTEERAEPTFRALEAEARAMLRGLPLPEDEPALRLADLRYAGQSWELTVPWPAGADPIAAFEAAHQRRYGYTRPDAPVEIVTLRVRLAAPGQAPLPPPPPLVAPDLGTARLVTGPGPAIDAPIRPRFSLAPGEQLRGPAILTQLDATTYVPPGWLAQVSAWGDLEISAAR